MYGFKCYKKWCVTILIIFFYFTARTSHWCNENFVGRGNRHLSCSQITAFIVQNYTQNIICKFLSYCLLYIDELNTEDNWMFKMCRKEKSNFKIYMTHACKVSFLLQWSNKFLVYCLSILQKLVWWDIFAPIFLP